MAQDNNDPQLDERVWQAWMKKNDLRDKLSFTRRVRVIGVLALFVGVTALLWRFTG